MNKNLKTALERQLSKLVDQFWWNISKKIGNFLLIPNLYISWPIQGHLRSNLGQNRKIRVKSGALLEIYSIYICFDSKFCEEFKFEIIWGQFRSSEVKIGSKLTNTREIRPIRRNIYNEHKFWRRISQGNSNCYGLRSIIIVKLEWIRVKKWI